MTACSTAEGDPDDSRQPGSLLLDEDAIAAVASAPPAVTISTEDDGQGRFMVAPDGSVMAKALVSDMSGERVARLHMLRYREELGLSADAIESAVLESAHTLRAGASIYRFTQRVNGLPVFGARANVVLDGDRNLVSLANGLVPSRITEAAVNPFVMPAELALIKAYLAVGGPELLREAISELDVLDGDWHVYGLSTQPGMLSAPETSVRRVMFRDGERLVPAFHIELLTRAPEDTRDQAYGLVVAADDGRVLYRKSLTANEAFNYRVYAEPTGQHIPLDGPLVDTTPHPTGVPENYQPAFAKPILVQMESFNKTKDPWLDKAATFSFGNNVRAYSDRNQANSFVGSNNGFNEGSDYRAETTAPLTFDRTYDLTQAPGASPDQIKASITQIFYVTNWLHDYYYDSGFDEASGNGQLSNYGRGGAENDPLLAEAQDSADGGSANNANMSAFSDGRSPRMQMYIWTGTPNRELATEPPIKIDDWLGAASFAPTTFSLTANDLVLSNDGSTRIPTGATGTGMGTLTDACQVPTNVMGKIAVIDRGVCTYVSKIQNAQMAGAVGVVVINNRPGHTAPNVSQNGVMVNIPVLIMSYEDGAKLKTLLSEGPVRATKFSRGVEVKRDGTIDNTVVAHEWGHYLHMRLQGGQGVQYSGMSEGWGDFNSLFMVIREGDTFPGKAYPLAQYAAGGFDSRSAYFGIRRAPYSVEYTMNPFTFRHIRADAELPDSAPVSVPGDDAMNEPHNIGEIWAEMLFEVYTNILEVGKTAGRPFEENKRRMADYVVASLKAAPDDATLAEQRDALLSAVRAMAAKDPTRVADVDAVARGFAKRGLGKMATAPARNSTNLNQVVESYVIAPTSP